MANAEPAAERGIQIGPLRRGQSPDDQAKCIFQLLNCVGIRCADIAKISVNPAGCYAKVVVHKKECEDYAIKILREIRSLMSLYDLRNLTDKPKYLKVERISPLSFEPRGISDFSGFMLYKEQQRVQQLKTLSTLPVAREPPASAPDNNVDKEIGVKEDKPANEDNFDLLSLTLSESTSATPPGFDRLEEESTPPKQQVQMANAATSTSTRERRRDPSVLEDGSKPGKVDAKTSTPEPGRTFCTGRDFYHRLQLLQREGNIHIDTGIIVRNDLRSFRKMIGRYVCAFLNSKGGTLYFGATQRGEIRGIPMEHECEDALRIDIDQQIKLIEPVVMTDRYTVNFTPIMDQTGNLIPDYKVIEITVRPGDHPDTKYIFEGTNFIWKSNRPVPNTRDVAV